MEVFVILKPDGTPFYRDDSMGILATDNEAQAIRFAYVREDHGAEYVRYTPNPPQPSASVSERAREFPISWSDYFARRGDWTRSHDYAAFEAAYEWACANLDALEQALTQQRGDDDGDGDPMTVLEAYAQGVNDALAGKHGAGSDPVMYQQIHRHLPNAQWTECSKATFDQYTNYHRQYGGEPPVRALYTTPQPSADAVRELVAGWRHIAGPDRNTHVGTEASKTFSQVLKQCADELESLLGRGG